MTAADPATAHGPPRERPRPKKESAAGRGNARRHDSKKHTREDTRP